MTTASTPTSCSGRSENKQPPPPPLQDSYEDAFDASLFLNEEYVSVSVPFGEVEGDEEEEEGEDRGGEGEQEGGNEKRKRERKKKHRFSLDLLCSQAASTDFDLTGQVLWPAASLLASFVVAGGGGGGGGGGEGNENSDSSSSGSSNDDNRGRRLASRSRSGCCELGAGLGLSGLAAVAFSGLAKLVLTDGSDVVLRVLEKNAQRVARASLADRGRESVSVSTSLLEWGDEAAAAKLRQEHSLGGKGFDLLLGADVTYSLSALPALFETAAMLLKGEEEEGEEEKGDAEEASKDGGEGDKEAEEAEEEKPEPTFLLGYVSRSAALDRAVPLEAEKAGFCVEVVEGTRKVLPGGQEGWILCLTRAAKRK